MNNFEMKVKELKELLKDIKDETDIYFEIEDGRFNQTTPLKVIRTEIDNLKKEPDITIVLKYC